MSWDQIKRSLVARGMWTLDGVSRKAKARFCRQCQAPVIAGLDHERSAMAAYLDPTPLNRMGEAMALLQRRPTYSLRWVGHYEIDMRYAEQITGSPAGSRSDMEVLQTHQCNSAQLADAFIGPHMAPRAIQPFGDDLDEPPF